MLVGERGRRALRAGIFANLAGIVALAAWLLVQAFPSTEAVRLRNSLLIEVGTAADFDWTPERMPPDFKSEQRAPTPEFVAAVQSAGVAAGTGDWPLARALAGVLSRNAQGKGPIQSDLHSTFREIVDEGRGYCADFVRAYLALARAAGLEARQWAFSFDGFGGHGHTMVEVYDRQRGKWVFLDVFNNVHAVDEARGEPLSALEFRDFVLGRRSAVVIERTAPGPLGYPVEAKLIDYYRRGADEWYLWWGNNVFTHDAHAAVRLAGRVSRSGEQLVAIAAGIYPHIKVLLTPQNSAAYERMRRLGWALRAAATLFFVLFVVLIVQVILLVGRSALPGSGRKPGAPSPGASAARGARGTEL